jgi:hypothetical protein
MIARTLAGHSPTGGGECVFSTIEKRIDVSLYALIWFRTHYRTEYDLRKI